MSDQIGCAIATELRAQRCNFEMTENLCLEVCKISGVYEEIFDIVDMWNYGKIDLKDAVQRVKDLASKVERVIAA